MLSENYGQQIDSCQWLTNLLKFHVSGFRVFDSDVRLYFYTRHGFVCNVQRETPETQ